MSFLSNALKVVGNVVKDVTRVSIAPIASSVNSIANKSVIDLHYDTKVGTVVGSTVSIGTDSVHKVLKGVANGVTAGYASKAIDLIRTKDAKSTTGAYEDRKQDTGGIGILDTFEKVSKGGAGIIGSVGGSLLASKGGAAGSKGVGAVETAAADTTKAANIAKEASGGIKAAEKVESAGLAVLGSGLTKATIENTGIAGGIIGTTLKTTNQDMSLLSSIGAAASQVGKAAQTPAGQAAVSILGSVLMAATQPKPPVVQNTAPQAAAFSTPTAANLTETMLSAAAAAAFGGSGQAKFIQAANVGTANNLTASTFWANNKTWLMPLSIGLGIVTGIIFLFKLVFTKRRR